MVDSSVPGDDVAGDDEADDGPLRADIAELARRRALTEDAARPDAVARRHKRGGHLARENVADLIDDGSWVEWSRYAVAAQRQVLLDDDLIARTPADGIVAGSGTVDDRPTAVLAYDYTVLARANSCHHKLVNL